MDLVTKLKLQVLYYYFIDHFYSKSTEEFINKIKKGDCFVGDDKNNIYRRVNYYFRFNKIILEKINLIKQKTGLNLRIVKNRLFLGKRKTNYYMKFKTLKFK